MINLFHDKIIHIWVKVFKNGTNKIYGKTNFKIFEVIWST